MSVVDSLFLFFYICCGIALGVFSGKHFGPACGIVGFLAGFAVPMASWRFVARRIGSGKTSGRATDKVEHGENQK